MSKYDTEDLLESILGVMTSGLNTKITEIETEKIAAGKGLTPGLVAIASDAYYLQTWTDKILNNKVGIFYGIEDVQTQDGGGAAAKTYKIFCEVVLVDNGQTNDTSKRIARYSRALEEIFLKAFADAVAYGKVKIDSVRPISFKLELDSDEEIKVGGVSLTITLV
jgi:hypothetical protein